MRRNIFKRFYRPEIRSINARARFRRKINLQLMNQHRLLVFKVVQFLFYIRKRFLLVKNLILRAKTVFKLNLRLVCDVLLNFYDLFLNPYELINPDKVKIFRSKCRSQRNISRTLILLNHCELFFNAFCPEPVHSPDINLIAHCQRELEFALFKTRNHHISELEIAGFKISGKTSIKRKLRKLVCKRNFNEFFALFHFERCNF